MHLPKLYKQTSSGKIQYWEVTVAEHPDHSHGYDIWTDFGQVGGKPQRTVDSVFEGKNKGKKNETTPEQQANLKAKQMWDKKAKSGYVENLDQAEQGDTNLPGIEPMLAFPIEDKEKYVKFPAWIQPKLDGFRCIAIVKDGVVTLYSRSRKVITTVPHINLQIQLAFKTDIILDGELYNHELKEDFPRLSGIIKRDEVHEDSQLIQYHIYDVVDQKLSWADRNYDVSVTLDKLPMPHLKVVPSKRAHSREQLEENFAEFLVDGYEGLMYRDVDAGYDNKVKRSPTLLKVKTMMDAEFKVVGVAEGNGKLMGKAGSLICVMENGTFFDVKMKGTIASLEDYLVNFYKYDGKMLTVQFQGYLPSGTPRFPVGLRFREDI